jgi:uncharacterized protein YjdB
MKILKKIIILSLTLFMFFSCTESKNTKNNPVNDVIESKSVELNKKSLKIGKNKQEKLTAKIEGNENLLWESLDKSIAEVSDDGTVIGISHGNTDIIVKTHDSKYQSVCNVVVYDLYFKNQSENINKDESKKAELFVYPESDRDKVVFESSDNNIVQILSDGTFCGISRGTANIKAKLFDIETSLEADCVVPVKGIYFTKNPISINVGDSAIAEYFVIPDDASNKQVQLSCDKKDIAFVSKNCVITAYSPGNATIQAITEDGKFSAKLYVAVNERTHTKSRYYELIKHSINTFTPNIIKLLFQVMHVDETPVTYMSSAANYLVYENNVLLPTDESSFRINKWTKVDSKLFTVFMIDVSSSMLQKDLDLIKSTIISLVKEADNSDSSLTENFTGNHFFKVCIFSEKTLCLNSSFTNKVSDIEDIISAVTPGAKTTNFYSAVIDGLSYFEDKINQNEITQGCLVLFSDGNDTTGMKTNSEALTARKDKKIISIGTGMQIDYNGLEELGNEGFYGLNEYSKLSNKLEKMRTYTNLLSLSFYELEYSSPKRGDNEHDLVLKINENLNSGVKAEIHTKFNSKDFYSE